MDGLKDNGEKERWATLLTTVGAFKFVIFKVIKDMTLTVCNFQSKFKHCLPMLVRSLCTSFMKFVLGMLKQKWVGQKDRQKDRKRVNT